MNMTLAQFRERTLSLRIFLLRYRVSILGQNTVELRKMPGPPCGNTSIIALNRQRSGKYRRHRDSGRGDRAIFVLGPSLRAYGHAMFKRTRVTSGHHLDSCKLPTRGLSWSGKHPHGTIRVYSYFE